MMGNYHVRCGAGEKSEVATPETYLSLFALPDDFCSLLSTMRSREISCNIIIQNLAQIKALFEKTWETITGNCSTLVYLGGNEQSTHKYISESLGKWTIDKKSTGESLGKSGGASRNYDVVGRELLLPDEVRKMKRTQCICIVQGEDPILDEKYRTFETEKYKEAKKLGNYKHNNIIRKQNKVMMLTEENSLEYYKKLSEHGKKIQVESFDLLTFLEFDFTKEDAKESIDFEEIKKIMKATPALENTDDKAEEEEKDFFYIMFNSNLSDQQQEELLLALEHGIDEETIKARMLNASFTAEKMCKIRRILELKEVT